MSFHLPTEAAGAPWQDLAFHRRDDIGVAATIVQANPLLCRRLRIDAPSLIFVEAGCKTLTGPSGRHTVHEGQCVALAGQHDFDIANEPGDGRPYRARSLTIAPALVAAPPPGVRPIASLVELAAPAPGLREAFERAMAAIEAGDALPAAVAANRVREVLLWLAEAGHCFPPPRPPELADRVRALLAAEPARAWRSDEVAARLGVSEATLRRKLAASGTGFGDLLIDIRMSAALFLLQSTGRPVTEIAGDVGYESPSRFAARFRARFDFSPSDIRSHHRGIARIGTEIERRRAAATAAE